MNANGKVYIIDKVARSSGYVEILSLDTTGEFGSIALVKDDRVIEEVPLHSTDGFGHILFGQIDRLLKRRSTALSDIDCFASASGPGSFTGVRVGLAAAKGLAESLGRPVVAVSNLQALAWFGSRDARATILDARRGEIYGAVFDGKLNEIAPETVARFTEWVGYYRCWRSSSSPRHRGCSLRQSRPRASQAPR